MPMRMVGLSLMLLTACGQGRTLGPTKGDQRTGDTFFVPGDSRLPPGDQGCVPCEVQEAQDSCTNYVAAFCAYVYNCYSGPELAQIETDNGWTSQNSCNTVFAGQICTDAALYDHIRAGRQYIDVTKAQNCVNTLNALACVPFDNFLVHPTVEAACEDTPMGNVPVDGACLTSPDCSPFDGHCSSAFNVCERRSGEDYEEICNTSVTCLGQECILYVQPNMQMLPGACSRACASDGDCGVGASCVNINSELLCVSTCLTPLDCSNGLTCVVLPGDVVGICTVTL